MRNCHADLSGFPHSVVLSPASLPAAQTPPTSRGAPPTQTQRKESGSRVRWRCPSTSRNSVAAAGTGQGGAGVERSHSQGADVARHDPGHPGGTNADDGLLGTAASGGAARQPPHLRAQRDEARGAQQQQPQRPAASPQRHAGTPGTRPIPDPCSHHRPALRARTRRRCRRGCRFPIGRRRCWRGRGRHGCGRPSRSRAACWPPPPLGAPPPAPGLLGGRRTRLTRAGLTSAPAPAAGPNQ